MLYNLGEVISDSRFVIIDMTQEQFQMMKDKIIDYLRSAGVSYKVENHEYINSLCAYQFNIRTHIDSIPKVLINGKDTHIQFITKDDSNYHNYKRIKYTDINFDSNHIKNEYKLYQLDELARFNQFGSAHNAITCAETYSSAYCDNLYKKKILENIIISLKELLPDSIVDLIKLKLKDIDYKLPDTLNIFE